MNPNRFRRFRRTAILPYLVLSTLLTACDTVQSSTASDSAVPAEPRFIFIGTHRGDPGWPAIDGGARRYAAQIGRIKLESVLPEDQSAECLRRAVRKVADSKPHVVCIMVQDRPEFEEALRTLVQAGAIIITIGEMIGGPESYASVIVDWAVAAAALGEALPGIAAGRRSYVLLHDTATPAGKRISDRFRQTAESLTGLTMLESRTTGADGERPGDVVRGMLDRFRHTGVVVSLDPAVWLAPDSSTLLRAENRFATLGAAPPLWPALREGRAVALVGPIDGDVGYAAMELGMRALIERKRLGVVRIIPTEIVTPDTLDDFVKRYEAAAKP
jgi:ABC-type sugar transport system substrate-binding protein